jgi:hypothetical protein
MPDSQQTRRYCRYCGVAVTPNDTFCSSCGKRLSSKEGQPLIEREVPTPLRARTKGLYSRLSWPTDASRAILAGILVAVSVAGLLVGLVYALLALRGAFEDPSMPRTLGLVVFSLVHGGAFSISVPP